MGLELHEAETSIGVGRRAVIQLLACEPRDEEAIALQRVEVYEARLARNSLRQQLETAKQHETPLPNWSW